MDEYARGTYLCPRSSMAERRTLNPKAVGSRPAGDTPFLLFHLYFLLFTLYYILLIMLDTGYKKLISNSFFFINRKTTDKLSE